MFHYKPPKELRALFIVHYAPLLLMILIGPMTAYYGVWKLPLPLLPTIIFGISVAHANIQIDIREGTQKTVPELAELDEWNRIPIGRIEEYDISTDAFFLERSNAF